MGGKTWAVLFLVLTPVVIASWKTSQEERHQIQQLRRGVHYHSKRHMLATDREPKRRPTTPRTREVRKKPSGHLTPLHEDEMDNDEVVSVAIGPPPIRPKYDRQTWKHPVLSKTPNTTNTSQGAANLVKDVLTQLGREFVTHQVNEDFVFGQYVGIAMKNLTSELRLKMQHEILEIVVKYQKLNRGDYSKPAEDKAMYKDMKMEKKIYSNDTEEGWPDFSNLAKIVG